MKTRLIGALVAYAILAALAGLTLSDAVVGIGSHTVSLRDAVWILLGGFALKTLIAYGKFRSEEAENSHSESGDTRD